MSSDFLDHELSARLRERAGAEGLTVDDLLTRLLSLPTPIRANTPNNLPALTYQARLIQQVSDAIIATDAALKITAWNRAAEQIYGWTEADALGQLLDDLLATVWINNDLGAAIQTLTAVGEWNGEIQQTTKFGQQLTIWASVNWVHDDNGAIIGGVTVNRNITQQKELEAHDQAFLNDLKALQIIYLELAQLDSMDRLYFNMVRLIRERLHMDRVGLFMIERASNELVGTYGIDAQGNLRDERYLREPLTDDHWTLRIVASPNRTRIQPHTDLYDNNQPVGLGWKVGTALWNGTEVLGYLVSDNLFTGQAPRPYQGELTAILGNMFGQLLSLKRVQTTLRESEARQRALLNAIPDVIFRYHRNGTFLDYHASHANQLLLDPNKLVGSNLGEVLPPDLVRFHARCVEQVLLTGEELVLEYVLPVGDQTHYFECRLVVSGEDEVLTLMRDITERRKAQALTLEVAKANLISQFGQTASHELRTPLAVINSVLYLMSKTPDEAKRHEQAARGWNQIIRLTRLLDTILTLTKLDSLTSLDFQTVDLTKCLHDTVEAVASYYPERGISIHLDIAPDVPLVRGDRHRLHEAFAQVLDNALRYTLEAGDVYIRIKYKESHVSIAITDSGVGISPDVLPLIFDRFWRQDEAHSTPGFGLGLSIAQKIITLHKGVIGVTSTVGQGSTFTIYLPHAPRESSEAGQI